MSKKFNTIWNCVNKNGELINTAKSAWGADRWSLGDVVITLEDDGYTQGIFAKGIQVRTTGRSGLKFSEGSETNLEELYQAFCLIWV
jgi:hypothetical protein